MPEPVAFTWPIVLVVAALVAFGAMLAVVFPRLVRLDAPLCRAVAVIYAVRVTAALGLFGLTMLVGSAPGSPVAGPGFWRGISDSVAYHNGAVEQVAARRRGIDIREPDFFGEFVAFVYAHVGANPLPVIVLNAIVDIVTLTLLLLLAAGMLGRSPPPWFVWGLGLWPSWLGWSVQLLKDALLLCLSTIAVVLAAAAVREAIHRREPARSGVLWFGLLLALASVGLIRSGVADVLSAAVGVAALWGWALALRGRTTWSAAVLLTVLTAFLPAQLLVRQLLYPGTSIAERVQAWSALGAAYEREGDSTKAVRAYSVVVSIYPGARFAQHRLSTLNNQVVGVPPGERFTMSGKAAIASSGLGALAIPALTDVPGAEESPWAQRLQGYFDRFSLEGVARLRQPVGRLQVAPDADLSTIGGLARFLPVGLAHALFGPFPWSVYSGDGATDALALSSLVELIWLLVIVPLGCVGLLVACRTGGTECGLIGAYVALGMFGLAIGVANDGLLFRYRLPFVVPLAAFVPLAVTALAGWRQRG